ncbi:MAG: vWA domain-containing protein [Nocardioides sp.]|uniref:vWA domain-containing protein n=1 Tax=Nocardioides sp. TaxID=35761 RepID=UPI003265335A
MPGGSPFSPAPPRVLTDPQAVAEELRRQSARTTGRAELVARHPGLGRVSPRTGELDEQALAAMLRDDADSAIALLADLTRATDRTVRAAARRLARTLALRPSASAGRSPSGRPRLETVTDPSAGDLDLDATLARLDVTPRLRGEDLRTRDWRRRGHAYVLLVDASGSVAGSRLATAVLTTGAVAARLRADDELAVLTFARDVLVLRPIGASNDPGDTLDALLDVRGGGTTDLAHGLRAGLDQAARARSPRRVLLVLTDGLATAGHDPLPVAAAAGRTGARVHVLDLADTDESRTASRALAAAGGGRRAALTRPHQAADAVGQVLGG